MKLLTKTLALCAILGGALPGYSQPTTTAPTPTLPQGRVISLYNSLGTYTNVTVETYFEGWWLPGTMGLYPIPSTSSSVLSYVGIECCGAIQLGAANTINVSGATNLHVDVYTPNGNNFKIRLVDTYGASSDVLFNAAGGVITSNGWVSLDIPLSQFTGLNKGFIRQMGWIVSEGGGVVPADYYIDNVYFSAGTNLVVVPPPPVPTPTNNAATPARPESSVISMYNSSGTYTDVTVDTWSAGWSGVAAFEDYTITNTSTVVKRYTGLSYSGVTFPPINASGMTTLHFDLWTPNANQFGVQLVSLAPNTQAGQVNFFPASGKITSNNWVSIDIPLTQFTDANGLVDLSNLEQLLWIDNQGGGGVVNGIFYIDNVYFWSTNQVLSSIKLGTQVSWNASSGNTYQPQESANGTTWANLGGVLSGTSVTNVFDATAAPFYQVQEVTSGAINGVLNGGFETSDVTAPYAANWLAAGSGGAITDPVRATTTDPYAGASALEIEGQGTGTVGAGPVALQNTIPAAPGSVTLSFQAKGALMSGGANPQYGIFWFDSSNNPLPGGGFTSIPGGLSGSYQLKTVNLTAPANTDHAQVQFLLAVGAGAGDHWLVRIDDVSLATVGAPVTNILSAAVQPAAGITWSSEAGRTYTVQSSPSVAPLTWSPLGANVLGTGTNAVPDAVNS